MQHVEYAAPKATNTLVYRQASPRSHPPTSTSSHAHLYIKPHPPPGLCKYTSLIVCATWSRPLALMQASPPAGRVGQQHVPPSACKHNPIEIPHNHLTHPTIHPSLASRQSSRLQVETQHSVCVCMHHSQHKLHLPQCIMVLPWLQSPIKLVSAGKIVTPVSTLC